jgi:hypothetical protein
MTLVLIMKRSDEYKLLAKGVLERASHERDPTLKASWKSLAESYLRLAVQTEEKISAKGDDDPIRDR